MSIFKKLEDKTIVRIIHFPIMPKDRQLLENSEIIQVLRISDITAIFEIFIID